jgi:pimeloyl-ACP methyl ester carboxylesterase
VATFVLIHGAFRGGWSWRRVRRLLQVAGHEVYAPSLTGAGERAHLCSADITLDVWINDVRRLLESEDLREVTLVGHSQGGVVITAASNAAADRIARLAYVDAPVPADGQAAVDLIPAAVRAQFGDPPREAIAPPTPVQPGLGISVEDANWINARLTPMPVRPSFDAVELNDPQALALPRSYAFCAHTPPFFPASFTRQRFDAAGIGYHLFDAGHDVILSHPHWVADWLSRLAEVL